jgi:cell division transport system permease protein
MKSRKKNLALKASTLIVVTACFSVLALSLLFTTNLKKVLTMWGEDVQMTVYLSQDLNDEGRAKIETFLHQDSNISEVNFVNQEHALKDFRVQLASYAPDVSQDDELLKLIPSSFQVKLSSNVKSSEQSAVLQGLAEKLRAFTGVDEVNYGQDWVEKYSSLVSAVEMSVQILGAILVFAALFVLSNVIRASVAARKDEIVVLEMLGATNRMIRRPFLKEGAVLGLTSSIFAVGLCFAVFALMKNLVSSQLHFLHLSENLTFLNAFWIAGFVFAGMMIGALGSYLCVRRINDGWAASRGS